MRRTVQLPVVLLLALAAVARAETGSIKGTITGGSGKGTPLADAVVMVEGLTVPAPAKPPRAVMDQKRETFIPHVLAVPVGTEVEFRNSDPMLHNVASGSPARRFDLGMFARGETRTVTLDAPGVVRLHCAVHPKMEAFIVVHTNPFAAVSDANGVYTITGVRPGHHELRVWHESFPETRVPVTVQAGSVAATDVRLGVKR